RRPHFLPTSPPSSELCESSASSWASASWERISTSSWASPYSSSSMTSCHLL
ncbi:hypothetical protein AK812_SmicGene47388, partial [Symbiodinium microadriaticum]